MLQKLGKLPACKLALAFFLFYIAVHFYCFLFRPFLPLLPPAYSFKKTKSDF